MTATKMQRSVSLSSSGFDGAHTDELGAVGLGQLAEPLATAGFQSLGAMQALTDSDWEELGQELALSDRQLAQLRSCVQRQSLVSSATSPPTGAAAGVSKRSGRSNTMGAGLAPITDSPEPPLAPADRAGATRSGFTSSARPITPSGKIPSAAPRRRNRATVDGVAAAGALKRRVKKKKKNKIETHGTFEIVKKSDGFNEAVKGGQVSMTGVVDRFVDQHADNLLIFFASKEFLGTNGVNRYRAALGLAWHYRLALYALLGGALALCVSIYDENAKLMALEQELDSTTAQQIDARESYQRLMVDQRISMMHTLHELPIRRGADPDTGKRFERSCQCFSHKHAIAQDYHLTGWEVHEQHSLTAKQVRIAASGMTRGSAKILAEQASLIQPLKAMRVFKVAEFLPHSDHPDSTNGAPPQDDHGYCADSARFTSHSCDDVAGGSTWKLLWQWSDRTPQDVDIPLVGPEDEAASVARAAHLGPDVEKDRVAQAAYEEEVLRQAEAKGKFYDLQPDYGILLRAHARYHFVVQIEYQMNYTQDDDLVEAARTVSGGVSPYDASGLVAKLTPRLRPKHAEVLTVGTLDFEILRNQPTLTTAVVRHRLAVDAGLMQDDVKVIGFGSMTRSLGEAVRLIHYRGGLPIAALTEKRFEYHWDRPQFSWLEDTSTLPENTTVRWAWEGPFNPHEAIEGQPLRQYARTGATTPRPPAKPWHPNRTLHNFTEPWYAGHELSLQPNDEIVVECTYEAEVPFTVSGGWARNSELCLAFIMVSPAGVLGWRGELVRPAQTGWRQGAVAPESQTWLTADLAYTASRGPNGHLRTCADTNADGVLNDGYDCSAEVRLLDALADTIPCMADPCTITECCTTMPGGASQG
jgi:hypothetical protein